MGIEIEGLSESAIVLENLRAVFDYSSRRAEPFGGGSQDHANLTRYCTGIKYPILNAVIPRELGQELDRDVVKEEVAYFNGLNAPFTWWLFGKKQKEEGDALLKNEGALPLGLVLGVIRSLEDESVIPELEPSIGITTRRVTQRAQVKSWFEIIAKTLQLDDEVAKGFYYLFSDITVASPFSHYLAYVDGAVVGVASLFLGNKHASIWHLAVLPEARMKGVGRELICRCLRDAKRLNCSKVVAILTPDRMAEGIFDALSFHPCCELYPYSWTGLASREEPPTVN